jgi:hypothetical protein
MNGVTSDAMYEWAHVGYDVLVDVARKPNSHITYQEIADALLDTTGFRAGGAMWIDTTLALVAEMCVRNGEPQLTALVAEADSLEVGDEFAVAYSIAGQLLPKNLQRAAGAGLVEGEARTRRSHGLRAVPSGVAPERPLRLLRLSPRYGLVAACSATMPPLRLRHRTDDQPAAEICRASSAWSGQARIDSARYT